MNITTEQTQKDREITQLLLSKNIIEDKSGLIGKCGQWKTKKEVKFRNYGELNYQVKCGNHSCRTCRRERIENQQMRHFLHNREFRDYGGSILLITLTIPHTKDDFLSFIHDRFTSSLTDMKRGWIWKKLKRDTDYVFHYDNIEITNNGRGHHIHNHITYGYLNEDVSIKEIEKELFNTWSFYTRKNGFRKLSKKGFDVSQTLVGGHFGESGSRSVKSIEESENIRGTLEYWESVMKKYEEEPNYTHPDKTIEQVGFEIKDLYEIFSKSKRGRIERNIPTPYIPFNQDTYTPEDLESILEGYNRVPNFQHQDFTKKELRNHIKVYNKVMKEQHYIRIYKSRGSWEWSSTPELPFS